MKLNRTLTVSGNQHIVIDDRVILGINEPGRAQFTIQALSDAIQSLSAVAFDIGYGSDDTDQRLFVGYVVSVTPIDNSHCKLFCREMIAVLNQPLPLSLRHPSLIDVLDAISQQTGLDFHTPDKPYTKVKIPYFSNIGNGYQAMDMLGRLFKIDDYFYQMQGGVVYVGAWIDSRWSAFNLDVDTSFFDEELSNGAIRLPAVPVLRPGNQLNSKRIKNLEFSGSFMTLNFI